MVTTAAISPDCSCEGHLHRPDFVADAGVPCATYREWLDRQAQSIKRRFTGTTKRPTCDHIKRRVHKAVQRSGGYDFYTGERLEWHLLNHPRATTGGRRAHCQRGRRPSVDHFTGVNAPDFRLCSGLVNDAKGALSHAHFVQLCRQVLATERAVAKIGSNHRGSGDRIARLHRGQSHPTAPSALNRATSPAANPSSSSTASVSVPAGKVARGGSVAVAE